MRTVSGWTVVLALLVSGCGEVSGPGQIEKSAREGGGPSHLLQATGMANPVADMRYYNGTYHGTPGTGTKSYLSGTLYRDNQDYGAASGCNGEGCGSHPGVDIPVPSNTPVYSAYSGRVFKSENNGCTTNGWGGLIIIKADNPYNSGVGDSIYFSYGHLNARYVSGTQVVPVGTQIGLSGGAGTDVCPGNSSGAHVHFQIDRGDADQAVRGCNRSSLPWFPSQINRSVNTRDTNVYVARCTYNPGPFVVGGYYWTFSKPGFSEYWTASNVASFSISGDAAVVDGNVDPYIWRSSGTVPCTDFSSSRPCSSAIAAEASLYRTVGLDLNLSACYDNPLKVYFITSVSGSWDEAKSVTAYPSAVGQTHIYMGGNPNWTGLITGIRIDPAGTCNPNAHDPDYVGYITIEH